MSRKKKRSKADEFEMDEAGYDEYTNSPAEQHIYEDAVSAEPEYRAPKVKKKKRKKRLPKLNRKIILIHSHKFQMRLPPRTILT